MGTITSQIIRQATSIGGQVNGAYASPSSPGGSIDIDPWNMTAGNNINKALGIQRYAAFRIYPIGPVKALNLSAQELAGQQLKQYSGVSVAYPPVYPFAVKIGSKVIVVTSPGWQFVDPSYSDGLQILPGYDANSQANISQQFVVDYASDAEIALATPDVVSSKVFPVSVFYGFPNSNGLNDVPTQNVPYFIATPNLVSIRFQTFAAAGVTIQQWVQNIEGDGEWATGDTIVLTATAQTSDRAVISPAGGFYWQVSSSDLLQITAFYRN